MEYFIADTHFGHKFCVDVATFKNEEEKRMKIVENWNSIVKDEDTVYVLGDFAYKANASLLKWLFFILKGKIVLIKGNHDGKLLKFNKNHNRFESIHERLEIELYGHIFVLDHYPLESWHGMSRNTIHLHGHTHDSKTTNRKNRKCMCVEMINYTPKSALEIIDDLKLGVPITTKIDFDVE